MIWIWSALQRTQWFLAGGTVLEGSRNIRRRDLAEEWSHWEPLPWQAAKEGSLGSGGPLHLVLGAVMSCLYLRSQAAMYSLWNHTNYTFPFTVYVCCSTHSSRKLLHALEPWMFLCYNFFSGFCFQGRYNQIPQIWFVSQFRGWKLQIKLSVRWVILTVGSGAWGSALGLFVLVLGDGCKSIGRHSSPISVFIFNALMLLFSFFFLLKQSLTIFLNLKHELDSSFFSLLSGGIAGVQGLLWQVCKDTWPRSTFSNFPSSSLIMLYFQTRPHCEAYQGPGFLYLYHDVHSSAYHTYFRVLHKEGVFSLQATSANSVSWLGPEW